MKSTELKTNDGRNSIAAANQKAGDKCISFAAVQRSATSDEEMQIAEKNLKAQLNNSKGMGNPLPEESRLFMEQRFGADFSQVQIHSDSEADEMSRQVSAHAFTHNQDIYFRAGRYNPESSDGKRLLAHELTHVVQQSLGPVEGTPVNGSGIAVSDPQDRFEREADNIAQQVISESYQDGFAPLTLSSGGGDGDIVQREEDDDDWLSSLGNLVTSAGSAVASGAGAAWDAGSAVVGDVGSTIASGAKNAWDTGSGIVSGVGSGLGAAAGGLAADAGNFAGEAWQGIKGAAGDVADFGSEVYGQMKEDAGYVQQGVGYVGKGIDWAEGEAKAGTHWLAQQADGIPVLEQLAGGAESAVDFSVDMTGGALKGVTGMAGGILGMAADPVDAAKGLWTMGEHIPGVGLPMKALGGAYDLASGDKSLEQAVGETLDPQADAKYWGNMGKALWSPLQASIDAGKPGEAVGNAGIQIAAMFTGAGEAGAAAEGAEAASLAAEASEGAGLAGKAGSVADVADLAGATESADAAAALTGSGMGIETLGTSAGELSGLSDADIEAYLSGMESEGEAGSYFEFPGQNPETGGGLQDITTRINANPNQIPYNVNHYFGDIGQSTIADMGNVPVGAERGIGGSLIPEGAGTGSNAIPQTSLATAEDGTVFNAAGEPIGSGNVEARYHAANPRFPDQGPSVQINTPKDNFGWGGDNSIAVERATGRYLLPNNTWIDMATLQAQIRAARAAGDLAELAALQDIARAAHWPVGF